MKIITAPSLTSNRAIRFRKSLTVSAYATEHE